MCHQCLAPQGRTRVFSCNSVKLGPRLQDPLKHLSTEPCARWTGYQGALPIRIHPWGGTGCHNTAAQTITWEEFELADIYSL